MVIIQLAGGLGNQLQQYAIYTKFLTLGKEAKLDLSWFDKSRQQGLYAPRKLELKRFANLPMTICTSEEKELFTSRSSIQKVFEKLSLSESKVFNETEMFHKDLFLLDNKYISGYFACEKYYSDILVQLRELLVFPAHHDIELQARNMDIMNEMEESDSVSVHIRRGDYLSKENSAILGNIATDAYYESAMNYFRAKYPSVHFYFFSDDSEYVRNKYGDGREITIVDWNTGDDSMLDIELMSHCKGNICANSTFSFWGARLNSQKNHEVVRTFTMRNNQPCDPVLMHDYWKDWILIDKDGSII